MAPGVIKKLKRILPRAKPSVRQPENPPLEPAAAAASAAQISLVPDGHFYSPIPSHADIRRNAERIFRIPENLTAIDLNVAEQLGTLTALAQYYEEMPFQRERTSGLRYFFHNPMFGACDGICLYGMIRHLKPKQIIEVGAGYSSCVMLDTNERFFDHSITCTFIEPNPESFLSLIKSDDLKRMQLMRVALQDADPGMFATLSANDILFIDSSHVSKAGSDVNYLVFEILPQLQKGVYIHFHDIFYPFEYPQRWICDLGISWNEAYLLRAFLQYNQSFRIGLFINYLERFHSERLHALVPRSAEGPGGGLWLRRL